MTVRPTGSVDATADLTELMDTANRHRVPVTRIRPLLLPAEPIRSSKPPDRSWWCPTAVANALGASTIATR